MSFYWGGVGLVSYVFLYNKTFSALNWLLRFIVKLSMQVPKTSKFKELKNKPLKRIKQAFPKDQKEIIELKNLFTTDPNLKYAGVHDDLILIIQCLFDDRFELLVESMDNIVISKRGVEILIFEFEKSASVEAYDRSIFIDITVYRSYIFQWRSIAVLGFSLATFLLSGSEYFRRSCLGMIP